MTVLDVRLVVGSVAIVVNCVFSQYMCTGRRVLRRRSGEAAAPAEQRRRHGAGIVVRRVEILNPAAFGCRGKVVRLLLPLLLLYEVTISPQLNEDMLQFGLVVWHATIQCLEALPHVTVRHSHTVHESDALLAWT